MRDAGMEVKCLSLPPASCILDFLVVRFAPSWLVPPCAALTHDAHTLV